MWPFKPKEKPAAAEFQMQGQPVHLNVPAGSRKNVKRHLSRILTCMTAIKKFQARDPVNQQQIASFQSEIQRRRALMGFAGHEVPEKEADILEELRRVGGV